MTPSFELSNRCDNQLYITARRSETGNQADGHKAAQARRLVGSGSFQEE
jgi:hypothetical protein